MELAGSNGKDRYCNYAIIDPFPQKHLEQDLCTHADGTLYFNLCNTGMDIGIDCIYDVQYPDHSNE